jgi:PPK2 family polyphosphate:nucleotide phosphotransferase
MKAAFRERHRSIREGHGFNGNAIMPFSNLHTKFIIEPQTVVTLDEINPAHGGLDLNEMTLPKLEPLGENNPPPSVDVYDKLIVMPGTEVKLSQIDPSYHDSYMSREAAVPETRFLLRKLDQLQYLMYAEKRHSLLIVLQGLDASGKDGVIRHILTGMNPAGCRVVGFKQPNAEELDHDFLWRVHPHLPAKGQVTIFNRSHYEDVLIVRVHEFVHVNLWSKRYELINDFERLLVKENNTTVLKFFLYISKEEQLVRFRQRLEDPSKHWKISEADYKEREYWGRYTDAFEDMLHKTSTAYAPWFVIPSNYKWFRDLAISQIVVRTLEDLDMNCPEPAVDITDIRSRYHDAEMKAS